MGLLVLLAMAASIVFALLLAIAIIKSHKGNKHGEHKDR